VTIPIAWSRDRLYKEGEIVTYDNKLWKILWETLWKAFQHPGRYHRLPTLETYDWRSIKANLKTTLPRNFELEIIKAFKGKLEQMDIIKKWAENENWKEKWKNLL
jgi:hypothetical protein